MMIGKNNIYRSLCSIMIMMLLAVFLFLLRYDVPLYGDDVGWLVSNNPDDKYLDGHVTEEMCTLNLDYSPSATWDKIKNAYVTWDGRVTARMIASLIRWIFSLPDAINWVLFSIYVASVIFGLYLLVVQAACDSIRAGINAPELILIIGLLLFFVPCYSYAYMTRIIMYVFTNIYVVSVILYLSLYRLIRQSFERAAGSLLTEQKKTRRDSRELTVGRLIVINVVGLAAGFSHEAYGVIFGTVMLTQLIRFWLEKHKKISIRYLLMYVGYLAGFCICFFAPGNFNRAAQSHESALRTVPLVTRLFNSFYVHAFIAYKVWIIPAVTVPVLVIAMIALLRTRVLTWREVAAAVVHNFEWFLGFLMSAITWGLVARVMNYGMLAANVLLIIGLVRVLREWWQCAMSRTAAGDRKIRMIRRTAVGGCLMVVLLMLAGNYSELMAVHHTADVWRDHIRLAREADMEETEVPAYPANLNSKFYELSRLNDQSQYDRIAYKVVYGTRIVIGGR